MLKRLFLFPLLIIAGQALSAQSCTATASLTVNVSSCRAYFNVFIEGYMNTGTGLMNTTLLTSNLLPHLQPYSASPYNFATAVNVGTFPANTVDWVYIQLRSASDRNTVVDETVALLRNDGVVMQSDGTPGVFFNNTGSGSYYVVIYHRNHMGVMSNSLVSLPNTSTTAFNFSSTATQAYGTSQTKLVGTKYCLYAGDYNGSGVINNLDYNIWYSNNSGVNVYLPQDGNGSGVINALDYNLWYANRSKVGMPEIQF